MKHYQSPKEPVKERFITNYLGKCPYCSLKVSIYIFPNAKCKMPIKKSDKIQKSGIINMQFSKSFCTWFQIVFLNFEYQGQKQKIFGGIDN